MTSKISIADLRELFSYDPLDGKIRRLKVESSCKFKEGSVIGYGMKRWYCCAIIRRKRYYCHRLSWALFYGEWPKGFIDHINGDRQDNRIENLRDVNNAINMQNRKRAQSNNKSSGLLGVSKEKKWFYARICVNSKQRIIGRFNTAMEAHEAYLLEKRSIHIGCTI